MADLLLYGLLAGLIALNVLLFVFLRFGLPLVLGGIADTLGTRVRAAALDFAFEQVEEKGKDGKSRTVLKPRPEFTALVDQVAPVLIARGLAWAKANIKVEDVAQIAGQAAGGFQMTPELLKTIPKEWRGIAGMIGPYLGPIIGRVLGGGAPPADKAAANPFLGEIKP